MLFHRVDDALKGNPISCTRRAFEEYCAFFAAHFEVVPLRELVRRLRAGEDIGGCLAITFDDGYLDNYSTAAPILEAHRLPATFFVTTDFIGSRHRPWWDEEYGATSRWMSWPEVRRLRATGFDLGAHTRTHVDLGVVEGGEAEFEIRGSRVRLGEEIGEPITLFSYPYGRAHQLAESNRGRVRAAGFECCLSAFGGLVSPGNDPFELRRTAVTPWHVSPDHFAFELLFP